MRLSPLRAGGVRPLAKDDIPLIFLVHDDRRFMRSLLAHYRGLGVTRFLCVDDRSTDGTREFLTGEPDVDVFESDVRYRDAKRGRLWREALVGLHGFDRWYLNVDSDEYLIYEDSEHRSLRDLFVFSSAVGSSAFRHPCWTCIPPRRRAPAAFDGSDERMPWQVAGWFDGTGYRVTKQRRGLSVRGGMRERLFGGEPELVKYPCCSGARGYILGSTIHQPMPFPMNFAPIYGMLLHFKFFTTSRRWLAPRSPTGSISPAHASISGSWRRSKAGSGSISMCADSRAFEGSRSLIDNGFIEPVFIRASA